jgi:hypothetical protein
VSVLLEEMTVIPVSGGCMERFNLRKLNDAEVEQQHQVRTSNRFAALKNLDDDDTDVTRAWESIK